MPEQGDIVLVPVPFTDLSLAKQRPVVVVSNDDYNRQRQDIVVVRNNPCLPETEAQARYHPNPGNAAHIYEAACVRGSAHQIHAVTC